MLSYIEAQYLKKCLKRIFGIFFILFLSVFIVYSCDLDFIIREKHLAKTNTVYPDGLIQSPIKKQDVLYNKELGLKVVGQIQVTGDLIGANADILRTRCPFQKERVELYNKYFQAVALSVKREQLPFAAIPQGRMVKQLLSKLSNDVSFLQKKMGHKVTLFGYALQLQDYPDVQMKHIVITKMIMDGKIYE